MVAHALGAGAVPADLEGAGFEVVVATDAEAALSCTSGGRADIAIVDGRFEGDGLTFCERLWAAHPGFPVLFLGPNDENLVTRALAAGADDYLLLLLRPADWSPGYERCFGAPPIGRAVPDRRNGCSTREMSGSTPRATR